MVTRRDLQYRESYHVYAGGQWHGKSQSGGSILGSCNLTYNDSVTKICNALTLISIRECQSRSCTLQVTQQRPTAKNHILAVGGV